VCNLEYRPQLFGNLHGALFLDAGNVWNLKDRTDNLNKGQNRYEDTKFTLKNFFRDMALGTGVGLRYDLDFLILRLDWGFALHVPYETGKSGFFNINSFKDSQTLHFAIGYPF
jgi:outer membrane protein assembly factor BamA